MRPSLCLFVFVVAGCEETSPPQPAVAPSSVASTSGPAPPAVSAPSSPPPSASASVVAAPRLPASLAAIVPDATLKAGPFAWPKDGVSAVVIGKDGTQSIVWRLGEKSGRVGAAVDGTLLRDLTGDGVPELIVFAPQLGTPSSAPNWLDRPERMLVLGVSPAQEVQRNRRLELALIGVRDEATLAKELEGLGKLGPTAVPLARLIVRLRAATPAEYAALVGDKGLKVCRRVGSKRTCKELSNKVIAKMTFDKAGAPGAYVFADYDEPESPGRVRSKYLAPPSCAPQTPGASSIVCTAGWGEPDGVDWLFEMTKSGPRLAEVGTWAETS